MKKFALIMVATLSVLGISEAWAFQPGERVFVGAANQSGVIIEEKGNLVKVRLDSQTGYSEGVGVWYDKTEHKVTSGVAPTTAAPGGDNKNGATTQGANAPTQGKQVKIGNQTGTILEEKGDLVKVRLDSHAGYSEGVGVWYTRAQLNGADNATNHATNTPAKAPAAPHNIAPVFPVNQNQNPPAQATHAQAPYTDGLKGIGAPPDGLYTCNKISVGRYIHIGTIEIRGGTYKGFSSQQGSFHPYSLTGSGDIVWTGGLTSMPDGWTLKPGKYVGPDPKGHPRIRIYYTSNRGAAEVIDATKEK
ncbi:MAG: hypothetical protein KIT34_07930 [Cyanobacteria bacterium TGS_CYA1]|nr:hypothetical protein [Cyanobacteria bacterium TGS_CYA1]